MSIIDRKNAQKENPRIFSLKFMAQERYSR